MNAGVKWFNTSFYPTQRTGRAVLYEEKILPRLRLEEVTFFTPWGPRYGYEKRGTSIAPCDKEMDLLRFFADTFTRISERFKENVPETKFRWIFLGADLYGTRINNLPDSVVGEYFKSLEQRIADVLPMATFTLWSSFDAEANTYRDSVSKTIRTVVGDTVYRRSVETARRMGLGGDSREYLIERIAEAMFIEERFHPVKISCVPRHKDDRVDHELPRLYIVPPELHAPWI